MHRLNLLGGASIEGPEGPLDGAIAQRQRLAFLAVLSASPKGLVSRDKLLALLWPELDSGRARRALSNALYVIRKELGEESVLVVGDDLRLDVEVVAVDALEFEALAQGGNLQEAVSLYTGPYLDGIHVKDAPEFEKWADGERHRLAVIHADTLEKLAVEAEEEGRLTAAAEWWNKLAVTDPFSSRIALELMKALAAAGDPAGALRYAQVHTTLLREEFDAAPDPAVTGLVDQLKRDSAGEVEGPVRGEDSASLEPTEPAGVKEREGAVAPDPGMPPPSTPEVVDSTPPSQEPGPTPTTVRQGLLDSLLNRIGRQKLIQWCLAYLAGAWFLLQLMDVVADSWGLSQAFQRTALIVLVFGFLVTATLAWYHGEEGRQRVRGPELLIIATLLVIAGGVLSMVGSREDESPPPGPTAGAREPNGLLTIAVLPFENFSPNPEDAYFAQGMHEDILTRLSRIDSLRVISRSSVMQFKENRPSVDEIASQLGADFILEGSARVAGGSVKLTAQLIDARVDDHIWSADYEQPVTLENLFAVQGLIADSVAFMTETTLTPGDETQIYQNPTDNLEAYELYLHGRFLWDQRTEPDMRRAIGLFQEAIDLDSTYAYAYVGLADTYLTLQSWDFIPFDEAIPLAEEALQHALDINPLLGEAHASMGLVLESRVAVPEAMASFQRSFELAPNHATGHHWYALLMVKGGYFQDALTHIRFAAGLDPLSRMIAANHGWILHLSRSSEAAVDHLEGLTQRVPDFAHGWLLLGEAYAGLGRYEDALSAMGRAVELEPWPNSLLEVGWVHAMAGNETEARALLHRFPLADPLRRAQVHGALGETARALELLEEGIATQSPFLSYLAVNPMWDRIRSDPGFQEILVRLGFPPGQG